MSAVLRPADTLREQVSAGREALRQAYAARPDPRELLHRHAQLIEVQCQREYEGKGAYPNYVMEGVINGFEENARKIGLKDLVGHPQIKGIFGWSRGGGWHGPYLKSELWPDLNAYVLGQFARNPARSEGEIFSQYARERLRLPEGDFERFRQLCRLSTVAVLKGRYCEAFDRALGESLLPAACWNRPAGASRKRPNSPPAATWSSATSSPWRPPPPSRHACVWARAWWR